MYLAAVLRAAGTAAVTIAPDRGQGGGNGEEGNEESDMSYQTALIRRVAATTTAVPPSIETAYDLT